MSKAWLYCHWCGFPQTEETENSEYAFRYLEDIINWRRVVSFDAKTGELHVDGFYQTTEGYDEGTNPRLECTNCSHEFELPDHWTLEFH